MPKVYLGLGTNLGCKSKNLKDAINLIALKLGKVCDVSSTYVSEPWGFESKNEFLNLVLLLDTNLSPIELLMQTQNLEQLLGRTTKATADYVDRLIDIDILLYDDRIIDFPNLKIPHPLMLKRDFVLVPLSKIAPQLIHPVLGKSMSELKMSLLKLD
jgi:2-amino-4-hydroxy-6-hydroxymethyldihydropteridine diphosphokinase